MIYVYFFFFSSRRRHTRYWRDWSSDVCSSDLDTHLGEAILGLLAVERRLAQVTEDEMHVGTARQHAHTVARVQQLRGHRLRALDRPLLALAERLGGRDLQRHRLARDHVLERTALLAREDGRVDLLGQLLGAQDHASAGATE